MNRNCPICGSFHKKTIYEQRFILPTKNAFHPGYDVVICEDCGFAFADNIPDPEVVEEYYRHMDKKSALLATYSEPESLLKQWKNSANEILKFVKKDDRVLDVGCYTGGLLKIIKDNGISNVLGLDPSPFASKFAADHNGIEVVVGALPNGPAIGRFDFIILTHVLEHIIDIHGFMDSIRSLLNPGGMIYIEVPNALDFYMSNDPEEQSEHSEPFKQFSIEHINYFSYVSLINFMQGYHNVSILEERLTISVISTVWKFGIGIVEDQDTEEKLMNYIDASSVVQEPMVAIIDGLIGKEIIVWGAGVHTQRLLACTNLGKAKIYAFIDSDPGYLGGKLIERPIFSPDCLKATPELPILISSRMYQSDIIKQIQKMGITDELILLY